MWTQETKCCIAGGGPAGMMLGLLLARQGVKSCGTGKHADFLRDFRGDNIRPSTLDVIDELGWLDESLQLPHTERSHVTVDMNRGPLTFANFRRLPTPCR